MTKCGPEPSPWARKPGFGGLIPFVGLAAALWVAQLRDWPLLSFALLGYGATIASFLGAIHWGLVIREGAAESVVSLVWGVVPSLLGWLALLLSHPTGLLLIAALLWGCFLVDRVLYPRHQLQAWLLMRLKLTVVASLSCIAGALALLYRA